MVQRLGLVLVLVGLVTVLGTVVTLLAHTAGSATPVLAALAAAVGGAQLVAGMLILERANDAARVAAAAAYQPLA